MRAVVLALTSLCGCSFSSPATPGSEGRDAGPSGDAAIDAVSIDARPPALCGGGFVKVCVDPPPTAAVTLTMATIDTSVPAMCTTYTSMTNTVACVIAGRTIAVPNKVTVVGDRPLILLASEMISISGTLDVASHRGAAPPAAADTGPCPTGFTNPTKGGAGDGGGGWGGSFGGGGGDGGDGGDQGKAGVAAAAITAAGLRGGCAGAAGAGTGGIAGHGGGAVALISNGSISIAGTLNASGGGGNGAKTSGGGGGGGSGGMIVLDAPSVTVTGRCFAIGGGGGEGANAAADGRDGSDPSGPNTSPDGGNGGTVYGGNGGAGAFGAALDGGTGGPGDQQGGALGGGGGGGGGAGVVKVIATTQAGTTDRAKVSPPPIP